VISRLMGLLAGKWVYFAFAGVIIAMFGWVYHEIKASIEARLEVEGYQIAIEQMANHAIITDKVLTAYEANQDAIRQQGQNVRERLAEISRDNQDIGNYLGVVTPPDLSQFLFDTTR